MLSSVVWGFFFLALNVQHIIAKVIYYAICLFDRVQYMHKYLLHEINVYMMHFIYFINIRPRPNDKQVVIHFYRYGRYKTKISLSWINVVTQFIWKNIYVFDRKINLPFCLLIHYISLVFKSKIYKE